jgi:hypothetical protein
VLRVDVEAELVEVLAPPPQPTITAARGIRAKLMTKGGRMAVRGRGGAAAAYRFCAKPKLRLKETGPWGGLPLAGSLWGSNNAPLPARSRLFQIRTRGWKDRGTLAATSSGLRLPRPIDAGVCRVKVRGI